MKRKSLDWKSLLVLLGLSAYGALGAEPGKTQHLTSPAAVPEGLSTADWTSIQAAYEVQRHQLVPAEGGYRA